jgi:hypothetical protein
LSRLTSPTISCVRNTGTGLVCRTLAFHCSLLEFRGAARLFNAACLFFPITAGALAKCSILFFTEGTLETTLCCSHSKTF